MSQRLTGPDIISLREQLEVFFLCCFGADSFLPLEKNVTDWLSNEKGVTAVSRNPLIF
jgi:hypothetical protein